MPGSHCPCPRGGHVLRPWCSEISRPSGSFHSQVPLPQGQQLSTHGVSGFSFLSREAGLASLPLGHRAGQGQGSPSCEFLGAGEGTPLPWGCSGAFPVTRGPFWGLRGQVHVPHPPPLPAAVLGSQAVAPAHRAPGWEPGPRAHAPSARPPRSAEGPPAGAKRSGTPQEGHLLHTGSGPPPRRPSATGSRGGGVEGGPRHPHTQPSGRSAAGAQDGCVGPRRVPNAWGARLQAPLAHAHATPVSPLDVGGAGYGCSPRTRGRPAVQVVLWRAAEQTGQSAQDRAPGGPGGGGGAGGPHSPGTRRSSTARKGTE